MYATCFLLEKPSVYLSGQEGQIQFPTGVVSFPSSDYALTRNFPLHGNRTSCSFTSDRSRGSRFEMIPKAIQERLGPDDFGRAVPDVHVSLSTDSSLLTLLYLWAENEWSADGTKRNWVDFDIVADWKDLKAASEDVSISEFKVDRWFLRHGVG